MQIDNLVVAFGESSESDIRTILHSMSFKLIINDISECLWDKYPMCVTII